MGGTRLGREESVRNQFGNRIEWNEEGWEEKRLEGIRLRREENGRNKVGKRREWKE